jgi:outer membrane receptor protein involved in Fe transport
MTDAIRPHGLPDPDDLDYGEARCPAPSVQEIIKNDAQPAPAVLAPTLALNLRDTAIGDITSITGYKRFKLFEYTDQDGTPIFLDDTRRTTKGWQFSQELRTRVNITDHINVIVGGFYLKDHFTHEQDLRINFGGGVTYDPVTGSVTYGLPGLFQLNRQKQDNSSISGFAQSYIKLTDQLRLQAGIRYTHEQTKMLASTVTSLSATGVTTFDGTDENGNPNTALGVVAPPLGVTSWNNVGWKLGLVGQRLQNAPKWLGSMGATWEFPIGGLTGRLGAQYNYTSEKLLTSIIDTPRARVQPQHIVNINADLKFNEHLRLSAYATNLFDNRYINSVFDAPGTLGLTNYAPPRLFGVAANYKF